MSELAARARSFEVEGGADDTGPDVRLSGVLRFADGEELWRELEQRLPADARGARLDLSGVESCDGAGAALLLALRARAREHGGEIELRGAREPVARLLALYGCPTEAPVLRQRRRRAGFLDQVGEATLETVLVLRQALAFIGRFVLSIRAAIRRPASVNWREIIHLCERAGADGVPIVLVINFLVGAIMALQAAEQLQRFGAGIFVADLVGLSMVRELAPLMTAIIGAGRSGAAFAAELGTMRVSEEVDALETLGLDPQRHLVFPRILAMLLVMPLLVLLADFVGCLGGLFVAVTAFDLTTVAYVTELGRALDLWDLFGGLLKGSVFAGVITLVSCQKGLSTRGGAEGVGLSTTSAVVSILFSLVALDALFTVIFNLFGI